MLDDPTPSEIIGAVAAFLKDKVAAETSPLIAFQARVAANALEIARRALDFGPASETAELVRLRAILGRDGVLADLNAEFAAKLAAGELDLSTSGVADQLWAATLAKLAVDQPGYAAYRAALAARAAADPPKET
jgi:hypothetical protein